MLEQPEEMKREDKKMCGLVGLMSSTALGKIEKGYFEDMLIVDQIRGVDSTGLFSVKQDGSVTVSKRAVDASMFVQCKQYNSAVIPSNLKVLAGHNRWATKGALVDDNAHPFKQGTVTMMHNGTLRSQHRMELGNKFGTDSEYLAYNLSITAPEDAKNVIKNIDGAFALVWYDTRDKTVNFCRNHERPLWWATQDDKTNKKTTKMLWGSELEMIDLCAGRNHIITDDFGEFRELRHYKVSCENNAVKLISETVCEAYVAYCGAPTQKKTQPASSQSGNVVVRGGPKDKNANNKSNAPALIGEATTDKIPEGQTAIPAGFPKKDDRVKITACYFQEYSAVSHVGKVPRGRIHYIFDYGVSDTMGDAVSFNHTEDDFDELASGANYTVSGTVQSVVWDGKEGAYFCNMCDVAKVKFTPKKIDPVKANLTLVKNTWKEDDKPFGPITDDDVDETYNQRNLRELREALERDEAQQLAIDMAFEKEDGKEWETLSEEIDGCTIVYGKKEVQPEKKPREGSLPPSNLDSTLRYIKGERGNLITLNQWTAATKHGCCYCCADIALTDSEHITWFDSYSPICVSCAADEDFGKGQE
jgi:hypothetical protein